MKSDLVDSIISNNNNNQRNKQYACSICKCDKLPMDIIKKSKYEIKILLSKSKLKESDFSNIIKKCNCTKQSPKVHKLCILLNVLYNFSLKCTECNTDYNIVIHQNKNTSKKLCNICTLIFYLFINLVIYAGAVFLVIYPLILNKNEDNDPEKNKSVHIYFFFGGVIFLINTFLIYIVISSILCNNSDDVNDYKIEVKDINEPNKNKNSDKYYNLLYKFYRYFYNSKIRFLIDKKHKNIYIAKGYGYFNKDLQNLIIQNNKEWEKENRLYNGGEDILNINKKKNKNGLSLLPDNNNRNEQSNGNIENNNDENVKRSSTLKEKGNINKDKEVINQETKNNTAYLPNLKNDNNFSPININDNKNNNNSINNNIINKEESDKKNNDLISNDLNGSESREKEQKKPKKIIMEIINTDKQIENDKKSQKDEIKSKHDSESYNMNNISHSEKDKILTNISNKSKKSKKSSSGKNNIPKVKQKVLEESKNERLSPKMRDKDEDKQYIEPTEIFKNDNIKDKNQNDEDKTSKKQLLEQSPIFDDNFNFFVSSPFHNNGK